jgi:signal transduction histidine kinase/CheY-like chemotaxis protein
VIARWVRARAFSTKLVWLTVGLVTLGLVVGSTLVLVGYEQNRLAGARDRAQVLALTVADYSAAALVFEDKIGATELLSKLKGNAGVPCAWLLDSENRVFARWERPGAGCPNPRLPAGKDEIRALVDVVHEGRVVGHLALQLSTDRLKGELRVAYVTVGLVALLMSLVCALAASKMVRLVTRPVLELAAATRRIGGATQFTERVRYEGKDEVGELYESFNRMLDELEQRRVELAASNARLRALLGALPDLVYLVNDSGGLVDVLAGTAKRGPKSSLVGQNLRDLGGGAAGKEIFEKLQQAFTQNRPTRSEYRMSAGDDPRSFEAVIAPLPPEAAGGARLALFVSRDVTERAQLEQRMRDVQKMEALGKLAGGVAHDFNNLLTGILGYAELSLLDAGPELKENLEAIRVAATQAADLTAQLLTFSRRKSPVAAPVDCGQLAQRVRRMVERTIDRRIVIETQIAERCWVIGDESQLESAVLNLVVNARDAMPEGGTLTLSVAPTTEDVAAEAGGVQELVELAVEDTGSGIPVEIQHRIFEPFFTTKEKDKGTGLGLSTVYGVVANHGGRIDFKSTAGAGTRFSVRLPKAKPASLKPEDRKPLPRGSGRLLLIDDDAVVLEIGRKVLTSLGYRVTTAPGGRQGIDIYRAFHREIDLVLLDMIMPELSGPQVAAALQQIEPKVRIVMVSGYSEESLEGFEPVAFVQKPYAREKLAEVVAAALDGARSAAARSAGR